MKDSLLNDSRPLVAVFDVKAFGLHTNAYIAAIGCVIMDIEAGREIASFYARCGANDNTQARRHKDPKAVAWWQARQDTHPAAFDELFNDEIKAEPLNKALTRLMRFIESNTPQGEVLQVVGKGPAMDDAILAQAYGQSDLDLPWSQANAHQLNSIVLASEWATDGVIVPPAMRVERSHDARLDARRDAAILLVSVRALKDLKAKAEQSDTHKKNVEPLKKALKVAGESIQKQILLMQAALVDHSAGNGAARAMWRMHNHLSQFNQVPTAEQMAAVNGDGETWINAGFKDVSEDRFELKIAGWEIDESTPFETVEASA